MSVDLSRHEGHTPGKWHWTGDADLHSLHLGSDASRRPVVLAFRRWGMAQAQPIFNVGMRLEDAADLLQFAVGDQSVRGYQSAKRDDSVYRYTIAAIDHPDARLIEDAPLLRAELVALREEYRVLHEALTKLVFHVDSALPALRAYPGTLPEAQTLKYRARQACEAADESLRRIKG